MAEVGTVMEMLLHEFQVPDMARLRRGDYNEIMKMVLDKGIMLRLTAGELECSEKSCHAEAVYTLNQIRKAALDATPCLRGLLREAESGSVSVKHDELVSCCVKHFQKWEAIISEACEQFSPDLWTFYETKFNQ